MSGKKHVAVLMGGWSAEREVSLVSGGAVCKALDALGHKVTAIDVQRDAAGLVRSLTQLAEGRPHVIFNALHGRGGEDGIIQGFLDIVGIPYTHSGVLASSIAMNKPLMKDVVSARGVRCAEGRTVTRLEVQTKGYPLPLPFVIKPIDEGSSVGVKIIQQGNNLAVIEEDSWIFGERALVETYVPGHELTVGLLGEKTNVKALGVTELRPKSGFYDYTSKYMDGMTDHLLPAPIPADVYAAAERMAEDSYLAIGCQGAARADFRWDDTKPGTTGLYFLELNTQPGLTPLSLLPEQAAFTGMDFNALIDWMLDHPTCPA